MAEGTPVVMETERLVLRQFVQDDLEALHEVLGDAETMSFYHHPFSLQETQAWIDANLRRYTEHGFGLWAVVLKDTDELVGDCGLTYQVFDGIRELEVGWHLNRRHWGNGYATEAGAACRDHAFDGLRVTRLTSMILPDNVRSRGVAERIGMHVEKEGDHSGMRHLLYVLERPPAT